MTSLRATKKLRTREALISTALALFREPGFAETTLDDLCAAAQVSRRTFFRYFASKEEVATVPTLDLWAAFLAEVRHRAPARAGDDHFALIRDAVFAAVDARPDDWAAQLRASRRLAATVPALDAHVLGYCDRTVAAALRSLSGDEPGSGELRLLLDFVAATVRNGIQTWISGPDDAGRGELVAELQRSFTRMSTVLTAVGTAR